jgi:hypothetical protein
MKIKASFPHIYLVGYDSDKGSSHRVTERSGPAKPKECAFFGNVGTENSEVTYGTLVIDETLWQKWYGDGPFIKGMETAANAAQTLIRLTGVYYGCPLCSFRTKKYEESAKHIDEHVNRFMTQFQIEVEE